MEKYRNGRTTAARGSVPSLASLAIRRKPRLIVMTDQRKAPRIIKNTPTIGRCCARKRTPVKRNSRIDFGSFCIPPVPIPSIHPILEATSELEQHRWYSVDRAPVEREPAARNAGNLPMQIPEER